ncbi:hypothetical protein UT300013_32120 [Paraclostridium sordellii]
MNKYKDWKMINWIIEGIVLMSFILIPNWIYDQTHIRYNIPIILSSIFLMYCFLSIAFFIKNKKINMVIHYCLVIVTCTSIIALYIIAYQSGV